MKLTKSASRYLASVISTLALSITCSNAQLTWDANGTGSGQTNGAGNWKGTGLWWNGATNVDWVNGSDALFGGPGTAGGTVAMTEDITAKSLTFQTFTGTYTLGTSGTVLTLNEGLTMNAGSGNVGLTASSIKLGGSQTWTNNSSGALTARSGVNTDGHTLTIAGIGAVSFDATDKVISGAGGLTKNGAGRLVLGAAGTIPAHSYSGVTTLNGGVTMVANNNLGPGNLVLNGGVIESYWTTSFIRKMGTGNGQFQITGGESGFSMNGANGMSVIIGNNASLAENDAIWGGALFNPSALVLQAASAQAGSSLNFQNRIDLAGADRTVQSNATAQGVTATISGAIRNSSGAPAGLIKTGPGSIILTAANTYNGGTTINGGTLRFASLASMPASGNVTVNDGGTLGVHVGAAGQWTTGTSGNGSIGGLLAGVGGQSGSTLSYTGHVGLQLEVSGTQEYTGTVDNIGASLSLRKSGSGSLALPGSHSYSGKTSIQEGVMVVNTLNHVGSGNSSLGAPTTVANGAIAIGWRGTAGTLRYIGDGDTTDRVIELAGATAGVNIESSGDGALTLTSNFSATFPTTANDQANKTLTLGGTNAESNTIAGLLPDTTLGTGTNRLSLTKAGTGRWRLTHNASTYSGVTHVSAGILEVVKMANGGIASSIGTSGNGDANLLLSNGATLRYVGSGDSSNRRFRINGSVDNHGATLDSSGTGALIFSNTSGPTFGTTNQTRTLTLRGSNTGANQIAGTITNNGSGAVSLVKEDAGKWVISAANTYTGTTSVHGGTLAMPSGSSASTIQIAAAATLELNLTSTITTTGTVQFAPGSKVRINGTPTLPTYTLFTSGSPITGTPEIETPVPEYQLTVEGNNLKLAKGADADSDGLPDWWEQLYAAPAPSDPLTGIAPGVDLDGDTLTNMQEFQLGTDPHLADTDADGYRDDRETNTGVWVSTTNTGTDPLNPDKDGDGLLDGTETHTGTWVDSADTGTNPFVADTDADSYPDNVETNTGNYVSANNTGTNPNRFDTDNDGAGDWYEITASFTNASNAASKPNIPYPLPAYDGSSGNPSKPVKVYIMSGQSNMFGYGQVTGSGPGTLNTMVNSEGKFPNLRSGGNWVTRSDVYMHAIVDNNSITKGYLRPEWKGDKYGPELGFGTVMGYHHDEGILLLKPSIGNRSLGWDYLPATSPRIIGTDGNTYAAYGESPLSWPTTTGAPGQFTWYAGKQYDDHFLDEKDMGPGVSWAIGMNYISGVQIKYNGSIYTSKAAHTAAANSEPGVGTNWTALWSVHSVNNVVDALDTFATQYAGTGQPFQGRDFQIAGFVWWQGHKDGGEQGTGAASEHAKAYQANLVRLITRLRAYYENRYPGKVVPNAPFVVATVGFGGGAWTPGSSADTIWKAQMAVSNQLPNVASVDTRNYWRTTSVSPGTQGFHYNWNAETYLLTGDACGRAMITLQSSSSGNSYENWIAGYPAVPLSLSGFDKDADGDGIQNGIENFFGTNPSVSTSGMIPGAVNGNTFVFTHPQNATPADGITAAYRWSKDLTTFRNGGQADGDGTTVTFVASPNTPTVGTTTVTATVTGTATSKLFIDVRVTQN